MSHNNVKMEIYFLNGIRVVLGYSHFYDKSEICDGIKMACSDTVIFNLN